MKITVKQCKKNTLVWNKRLSIEQYQMFCNIHVNINLIHDGDAKLPEFSLKNYMKQTNKAGINYLALEERRWIKHPLGHVGISCFHICLKSWGLFVIIKKPSSTFPLSVKVCFQQKTSFTIHVNLLTWSFGFVTKMTSRI